MSKIKVVSAKEEHYSEFIKIYKECFLPKFNFVYSGTDYNIIDDIGIINLSTEGRYFVAVEEGRVLGVLVLGTSKQLFKENLNISTTEFIKRYGILGVFKSLLLKVVFKHEIKPEEMYLNSIGVSSDARGKGVGSILLEFAKNRASEFGYDYLSLSVMLENEKAKKLYENVGFNVVKSEKSTLLKILTGYTGYHGMECRFTSSTN